MNRLHQNQNQNQKGRPCRSMKRGSRKLLGLLIAGLLLGGFAAPAYAAEGTKEPDISFDGYANIAGNPVKEDGQEASLIPDKDPITGINVTLNHKDKMTYWYNTTAALVFKGTGEGSNGESSKTYTITGDVYVVNTVMSGQDTVEGTKDAGGAVNNDAIYAKNGASVTITGDKVYLASIASDEKNIVPASVVFGSIDPTNIDSTIVGEIFGNMDKIANNSSVLAAKGYDIDPYSPSPNLNNIINNITVSGSTVQLIGNLDFIGNNSGKHNTITATLNGPDSFWYGDESNLPMSTEDMKKEISNKYPGLASMINNFLDKKIKEAYPGTLDVTLANGAEWIYNANPSITALTLKGGIVNLQDEDIQNTYDNTSILDADGNKTEYKLSDYRKVVKSEDKGVETNPHTYVDIGTLKGSGTFKADIDWEDNLGNSYTVDKRGDVPEGSDYIFITTSESGTNQTLSFDESKAHLEDMKAGVDKLYFATVSDGKTQFQTEQSVYSNAANVFNYDYKAEDEESKSYSADPNSRDWFIKVTGKTAEDNANFTAARSLMDAGYAMGTELDTLNKRMGEARYLDSDQGLWVRYRHGRSSRDDSYKTDSDMLQLGYDRKTDAGNGTHHRGVAFDYTDADTSLYQLSGSGDVDRYALSLYDTWMGSKGHYYDFVIRGGRINSGYDISGRFSTGMESMDNSYHQWFGSVSFEYGRKKDMSGSWYIEPQAQLQLARIGGASFTSASGVRTELDGTTSLIGRAGFRLGREFGSDGSDRNTFYIKADILHEFAGDRGFTLTGNDGWYAQNDNGTDTWYDVGIGVDLSLGHSTYFWTDVERILGSDFDNTWQVSGGLRWKW